jgi:hypothetical protein
VGCFVFVFLSFAVVRPGGKFHVGAEKNWYSKRVKVMLGDEAMKNTKAEKAVSAAKIKEKAKGVKKTRARIGKVDGPLKHSSTSVRAGPQCVIITIADL